MKIGILGGIGPEATGKFYIKLIKALQYSGLIKSNRDFPQIIINSIPAPELIHEDISDQELIPYLQGLKELDSLNVDFIVMVCNTIHLFYDYLQNEIKTEIIDLRKELKKQLDEQNIKSALLIGTPNTIKRRLYKAKKTYSPNDKEIRELTKTIYLFNKGIEKDKQIIKVKNICNKYLDQGAKTVILGCTEFAVMLDKENLPKINTIEVLVDAVIKRITTSQELSL